MYRAARAVGISVLALSIGLGTAACGSSPAPGTNAPSSASTASTAGVVHKSADVVTSLNAFLSSVATETKAGLAAAADENGQVTSKEVTETEAKAELQKNYPESLKHLDQKALGEEKTQTVMGIFGMLTMMSATATAEDKGIIIENDSATVPAEALSVTANGKTEAGKSGVFTLKYVGGKWLVTNYEVSGEDSAPSEASTSDVSSDGPSVAP